MAEQLTGISENGLALDYELLDPFVMPRIAMDQRPTATTTISMETIGTQLGMQQSFEFQNESYTQVRPVWSKRYSLK